MRIRLPRDAAGAVADFVDRMVPMIDLLRLATSSQCGVEAITLTMATNKAPSVTTWRARETR